MKPDYQIDISEEEWATIKAHGGGYAMLKDKKIILINVLR